MPMKEFKKELEEIAASDDRSVSWLVGKVLDEFLKSFKEKSRDL
jgi:predicted DNA-binding ribbon-helix-helix protein